jgi:hypothetical protein
MQTSAREWSIRMIRSNRSASLSQRPVSAITFPRHKINPEALPTLTFCDLSVTASDCSGSTAKSASRRLSLFL